MSDSLHGDHFATIPEWILYADIGANAVRLYGVLNRHLGMNEFAWPSRALLAEKMHCVEGTVDTAIKELIKIGALTKKGRVNEAGHRTSSAYYLHAINPETLALQKSDSATQKLTLGGSKTEEEREPSKESQNISSSIDSYPAEFEELWRTYPRHEDKKAAWRKVKALLKKGHRYSEMTDAVENYAAIVLGRESRHIKLASTFFGPDEYWREMVRPGLVFSGVIYPKDNEPDPIAEAERRRRESAPPPTNFAKTIRKQMNGETHDQ